MEFWGLGSWKMFLVWERKCFLIHSHPIAQTKAPTFATTHTVPMSF